MLGVGGISLSNADATAVTSPTGKDFILLRDQAIIRLYYSTGARLSEVANLHLDDVELATESVRDHGKGSKERRVRFGPKTAWALRRYLRARAKHEGAELPDLWLADRGARRLAANGVKIMLKLRGLAVGLHGVHAHARGTTSPTSGNGPRLGSTCSSPHRAS